MDLWNYLGSNKYNTSAFSIVLDLPIDLTNFKEELNEFQFSLYLHEYIHFLQDISTMYGLMKLSDIILYTKAQAAYAVSKRISNIKIPAHAPSDVRLFSYVKRNYDLMPIYMGDTVRTLPRDNKHPFDKSIVKIVAIEEKLIIKPNIKEKIETLRVTIEDRNGNKESIVFGGEIICENMASMAEHGYLANLNKVPASPTTEYPYRLAEKLAEYIYPNITTIPTEWIFWMMDLCLSTAFNPGYVFYLLIKELKDVDFANNPNDEKLLDILKNIVNGGRYKLEDMYKEILDEFDQIFYLPMFKANKDWLKAEFERILFLRQNPRIMRYFMQYDGDGLSRVAKIVIDLLGHPTVKNDLSEAIIKPPAKALQFHQVMNICLWYFEAYKEVFLALNSRGHHCQMYKDCIRSKIISNDVKRTGICPEQQSIYSAVIPKSLFPFGVFWRSLGLWGKKPV